MMSVLLTLVLSQQILSVTLRKNLRNSYLRKFLVKRLYVKIRRKLKLTQILDVSTLVKRCPGH
jgi:hypothetical protein